MAATLPRYPTSLMREDSVQFDLAGVAAGSGQTMSGLMPMTRLDGGGIWKAAMNSVSLRTANQVRAWRAVAALADNGAQPMVVPMCDKRYMPAPVVAGARLVEVDDKPHDDGAFFDDGTGYEGSVVEISLAADAALRATALTVTLTAGSDLMGGEHFAIDHNSLRWRLYRIRTAIDNGDGTWNITIRPPLRAAVDAGAELEFDRPKCVMRLAAPDAMDLTLSQRRRATPSVSFLEAFPPFPT